MESKILKIAQRNKGKPTLLSKYQNMQHVIVKI